MNKFLLVALATATGSGLYAQLPVSTAPQNKKVVLEEFTGIKCGYCPDGHVKANTIYNADPTKVILVNIHSGSFANANAGEPDFKTTDGNAIDAMPGMLIAGYPAGAVNRMTWTSAQTTGGMAQSRGSWASSANTIKSQPAYCNVALQGTIDVNTRMLNVEAQVYYTANSPVSSNSLTIMLLENKVIGPQSNYGLPYWNLPNYMPDGKYYHNHLLRKVLTPTFGQTIPATNSGTTFSTTVNYSIPLTFGATGKTTNCNLAELELVAFVTETDVKIINAAHGPIYYSSLANTLDIATNNLNVEATVCDGGINPTFEFTNNGSTPITSAVFSYAVNGGAPTNYTWTGTAVTALDQSPEIVLPSIAFTPQNNNTLTINVVSVNGSADQNAANNVITKAIPLTTKIANNLDMTMEFSQDRWGSETKWTLYEEQSNNIVATDGPWSNLGNNSTQLNTQNFTVNYNTCYKLVIEDTGGNGINLGFGTGGYVLKSDIATVLSSNGKFGYGETVFFKTRSDVGISESNLSISAVGLQPNPANNAAKVVFNLTQNENIAVSVINSLGQKVFEKASSNFNAGEASVEISTENFANGIYFVNVSSNKGTVTKKLTVAH